MSAQRPLTWSIDPSSSRKQRWIVCIFLGVRDLQHITLPRIHLGCSSSLNLGPAANGGFFLADLADHGSRATILAAWAQFPVAAGKAGDFTGRHARRPIAFRRK